MSSADILRVGAELPLAIDRKDMPHTIVMRDARGIAVFGMCHPKGQEIKAIGFVERACNSHYALLDIAKRWAAIDGGAWHVERYEREREELLADTRAAIAAAEAEAGR